MKSRMQNLLRAIGELAKKLFTHKEARYGIYAVLTVIFAEVLNTGSPLQALSYAIRQPLSFIAAVSLIYATYMLTLLIPKRIGSFVIVMSTWVGLAIANCVLLSTRVNPLSAVDFTILLSVISIFEVYLSVFQIILICAAILGAIVVAVVAMIKLPSEKPVYKKALIRFGASVLFCAAMIFTSLQVNSPEMEEKNMPSAYEEYGFVYCFALSTADRGIDRPAEYSGWGIWEVIGQLESNIGSKKEESDGPNIVIVQLESFFDPTEIKGIETSSDAIPFFRSLKESFPSGYLEVPVSGAGTVNTEFEVLCGIPLQGFGMGEYPYESILEKSPCESLAYYLGNEGYACHAIHNHWGNFYNRNVVMRNLGFDTFVPVEYMNEVERNAIGWAEDAVLTDEISGVMDTTEGADLVYAISVQPHGKYSTEPGDYGEIKVTGTSRYKEDDLNAMEYYVNQLSDTDSAVAQIVSELSLRDEDTVAIFFGDHLPALELTDADVEAGSIYKTEYVIWSNFELEAEDCDLESYRLSSYILDALDIEGGLISEYHSRFYGEDNYLVNLKDIAYDLLFGEKYGYEGKFPYEVPDMKFGWRSFCVTETKLKYETLYVMGEGFTECSKVYIDGRRAETVYISEGLIVCPGIKEAGEIEVAQTSDDGTVIGEKVKKQAQFDTVE